MKPITLVVAAALVLAFVPVTGYAQERVTIDASYIGRNFSNASSQDENERITRTIEGGEKYSSNGIDLDARVKVISDVAVGWRFQHSWLGNARAFDESLINGKNVYNEEPDPGNHDSSVGYQEVYGSLKLPKTHGHSLVVGAMWFDYSWSWTGYYPSTGVRTWPNQISYTGVVIGGEGKQKIGKLSLDYSGRWFPHAVRSNKPDDPAVKSSYSSNGFELRGTGSWPLSKHIGLTGGYQFRQIRTALEFVNVIGITYHFHGNQTDKGFLVGLRLSF